MLILGDCRGLFQEASVLLQIDRSLASLLLQLVQMLVKLAFAVRVASLPA